MINNSTKVALFACAALLLVSPSPILAAQSSSNSSSDTVRAKDTSRTNTSNTSPRLPSQPGTNQQYRKCGDISYPTKNQSGFGVPYDIFNGNHAQTVYATCSDDGFAPTVQLDADPKDFLVYNIGYYWNGQSWKSFKYGNVTGAPVQSSSPWIATAAVANNIPYQGDVSYFLAYTCQLVGGVYKCGCADQACRTPGWQLQKITRSGETIKIDKLVN